MPDSLTTLPAPEISMETDVPDALHTFDGGKPNPSRRLREYEANSPESAALRRNALFRGKPIAFTCWAVLSREDMHLIGFFTTHTEADEWKKEIVIELNGVWPK